MVFVENNYCDWKCKYARIPKKLRDGSSSCRSFVDIYCKLKKRIVYKNLVCEEYKESSA